MSQGDEPDLLIVSLELGMYRDVNGNRLDDKVLLKVLIPRQFSSKVEQRVVESLSNSVDSSLKTVFSWGFAMNVLMFSSLGLIWTAVNGLQLIAYTPLFSLKIPANA